MTQLSWLYIFGKILVTMTLGFHGFCYHVCLQIVAVAETAKKLAQIQEQFSITDDFVYLLGEDEFVMPGFIDTHIHAPQFPNAGLGYDKELLDWLTTYTFPLEMKYSDLNFATKVYEAVVVSNLDSNEVTLSSKQHLWNFVDPKEYIF